MKKIQIKSAISAAVLGVLSPLAMVVPASAATQTWTGAIDEYFSAGTNWVSGVPTTGDTAVFPASANFQGPVLDTPSLSLAKVVFNGEVSGTSSKSYLLSSNASTNLTLSEGIDAIMTGNGGNHSVLADITLGANITFKTTGSNTLSVGEDDTTLALGTNDLTLDASGGTVALFGKITGSGNLVKAGSGKVQISTSPGTGGYTGSLSIPSGEVNANGTLGNVTLSGGTLKGSGTVGNVAMSAGSVAPGNSPGVINTGNLTYTGGSFDVELGGTAAGEFDQTNVTGTVDLGSATTLSIALVNDYAPAVNDAFVVINNDAADAVTGTFVGLANGAKTTLSGYTYQINYDAGDGNDVILLVTGTPSAPDTGVGSLISSPFATLAAAIAVAGAIISLRRYELKKSRK